MEEAKKKKREKTKKEREKAEEKRKRSLSFFPPFFALFFAFLIIIFAFWPLKNNAKIAFAVAFCLPIVAAVVVALAGGVGEARE